MRLALLDNLFGFEREETPGEVIFFRVFEAFVALASAYLAWTWGQYVTRISEVVLPLGIAQYVDVSFMFGNALPLVNAGAITLLLVLGYARRGRYAYFVAFLLLHLQYAARYCLGEIPHSSNILAMTLLGLALAFMLYDSGTYRRRFTLGFTYFYLGLGYMLAGWCKLIGTGPLWPHGRHLWIWINEKSIDHFSKTGTLSFNTLQDWALADMRVATLFLTIGLVTELLAFLVWWRAPRRLTLFGILGLHIGIYLTMNILFYLSVIELVLLLVPWAAGIDWVLKQSTPATQGKVLRWVVPSA